MCLLLVALPPEEGHRDVRCAGLWATGAGLIMSDNVTVAFPIGLVALPPVIIKDMH